MRVVEKYRLLDETPGLDDAARKKIPLLALVLNAWGFHIYRKVH